MINKNNISMSVIRRLPRYYRYLTELERKEVIRISSSDLSDLLGFTASQIRQDFNCFGGFGQQGYGYSVTNLKNEIGKILGINTQKECILIGAGNLGRALLSINYAKMGFNLSAVFDADEKKIGSDFRGYTVLSDDRLSDYAKEHDVQMAIICTPTSVVEELSEKLYALGIKSFWNFTSFDINMKYPDAQVEHVHLNDSLMTLCYLMSNNNED